MRPTLPKSFLLPICVICLIFVETVYFQSSNSISRLADPPTETDAQKLSRQWNRNLITRAIEIYRRDAASFEKTGSPDKAAASLREAGQLWLILGNKEKGKQLFKSALAILKSRTNSAERSKIYSELSLLDLNEGNLTESRNLFEKAILFAKNSNDNAALAAAFYSAGEYFYFRNETAVSLDYYRQSVERWRLAGNPQGEGKTLLSFGYLYLMKSEFDLGLDTFNAALSRFQEADDLRGQALTYKGMGTIFNHLNENQKALESFQKAESLFPEDIDYTERAMLYNWFGKVFEDYGNWRLSLSYREKAFNLFEKDGHLYGQLATLPSLGKLNSMVGDDESALNYLFKAEKLARRLSDNFYLATVNDEIGNIYFKRNDFQNAVLFFNKALKLFQSRIYQKQIASVYNKLGQIYKAQNNSAAAQKYFTDSINLSRSVKDRFGEAEALYHLAAINSQNSKLEDALRLAKDSIVVTESLYSDVLNSKLQSIYFSNVYDRYELYINLLMKMDKASSNQNYEIEALQAAEKARARVILENLSLSEANFTKDADAETVRREKEIRALLNTKADKLTDLLSQKADQREAAKVSGEINELENELENIKARLKQQSPVYAAIKNPAPFDVADFQQKILDENSLLLEFSFGAEESYLWLVGKNEISVSVLPAREQIETQIEALRGLLKERELKPGESVADFQNRIGEAETKYERDAKELSRQLFGQIAGKLANKRLIIVPDGELHYFPVAALPNPESARGEPILLTNETIYEPSAQTLVVLAGSRKQSAAPKNLLVFSDPIFTSDDARFADVKKTAPIETSETAQTDKFRFAESLNNLPRLSASRDESETIIGIIGAANAVNYSGFAATREKLLDINTADFRILHFATHGLTNEEHPELSGIVLSRFDEKGQKLNEFFRIQDIYALELNADLVVLSACETGIGKEVKGEGLMSLNNAFLQTGAKSVVASLWKVEDGATLELMRNFYGAMAYERLTPSAALRRAQIKLRENPQYGSPFYWAAFTVQGDFRSVPEIADGYPWWAYLLPVLPLALIGFYLFRRKYYSTAKP
jgi:CHAT domain-containing protein